MQWMLLLGHCCLPTIGKIARQNTAVNIHWIQECSLAEKCKRHPQKTSVQHGCILLSKFNDFLSPSEKIEKSKFEPLLEVWGHSYIVRNTMRKVGLPVKIRGQPSPYDDPFWRYVFAVFAQISTIILQIGPQITWPINISSWSNLNHLEDTLGELEPQLEFYHRYGVGASALGPGLPWLCYWIIDWVSILQYYMKC